MPERQRNCHTEQQLSAPEESIFLIGVSINPYNLGTGKQEQSKTKQNSSIMEDLRSELNSMCVCGLLVTDDRISHMLGTHCTTKLHLQSLS